MNIVLFGPPGAGKGTQSELLVKKMGMLHISTGDLFRAAIKGKTELGEKAQSYMDQGALVPDEIVIGMVEEKLSEPEVKNFILDGFPRTKPQAVALGEMLKSRGIDFERAVFLQVDHKILLDRLCGRRLCKGCGRVFHIQANPPKKEGICDYCGSSLEQRSDDKESVINHRLEAYEKSTEPLVDFYKKKGKYVEIDGLGEASEIFERIQEVLQN